ncbi:MAG: outer membrane protein assembly factor [Bacteroidia bacterium]|nr:outer membrane protein assembly factor [Bacteroidia bacterium]
MWVRVLIGIVGVGWAQDTILIDRRRYLTQYDLTRKREKWVITGYPLAGYDALRGIGAGVAALIAYNGHRSDPTFAFTPYKYHLFTQVGGFLRGSRYLRLFYDMPWIHNRPYRVTLRLSYREENQGQFWGIGERTFDRAFPEPSLASYEARLSIAMLDSSGTWQTSIAQHQFYIKQWQGWLIGERIAYRGLMRLMWGLRWTGEYLASLKGETYFLPTPAGNKVSALQRPTLIDSAVQGLSPVVKHTSILLNRWQHRWMLGGAVVWDTRDFELNPNRGWLIELNHESRIPDFATHKSTLSIRNYHLWYKSPSEAVQISGAVHLLMTATYGSALPLTDLQIHTRWADGRLPNLLSGPSTLRAFRENRFLAPYAYLFQYEVRSRLGELRIWRQHFTGGPVIFADIAAARDKLGSPSPKYLASGMGTGVRLLWNMSTVVRADAAYGREGWQLHFTTTHPF